MSIRQFIAQKAAEQKAKAEADRIAREQAEQQAREKAELAKQQRQKEVEELREKIKNSPLMAGLMLELQKESWILCKQDASETGRREFAFSADGIQIEWTQIREETHESYNRLGMVRYDSEWIRDSIAKIAYSYTKSGYAPLGAYKSLSANDVLHYWREEWENRMKELVPGISIAWDHYYLPTPSRNAF